MEHAHNEGREAILWAIGLPLAVVAATLTLLYLLSAVIGTDPNTRDLHISLLLVGGFGLPSALIARAMRRRRPGGWTYYALSGAAAGFVGIAALVLLLIWADGKQEVLAPVARMTWPKAANLALLTATSAWPGAIAGLAGGTIFGLFAKWADKSNPASSPA